MFTEPQIATVGAREQDLSHQRPYVEAVQEYADVVYGWALQDTTGFCKLYADAATGTLLGAHIMGDQASLLIQPLIQAAAAGRRVADLARGQYWIHPALTEVIENALLKLPLDHAPSSARLIRGWGPVGCAAERPIARTSGDLVRLLEARRDLRGARGSTRTW